MKYVAFWAMAFTCSLLSGCGATENIAAVDSAENIISTTKGRIFVTGKNALYELRDATGEVVAVDVYSSKTCDYYAGLAELNNWLFFVCVHLSELSTDTFKFKNAGHVLAYSLLTEEVVHAATLNDFQLPNGMDSVKAENALLLAEEDLLAGNGSVSKLIFDFGTGIPVLLDYKYRWLNHDHGVYSANGVSQQGNVIYLTDLGSFKKVTLNSDGTPSNAEEIYKTNSVLDDFDLICDGALVTDYVGSKLVYVSLDGETSKVLARGLNLPSAVSVSAESLLGDDSILVTESFGVLPGAGNQVVRLSKEALGLEEICSHL